MASPLPDDSVAVRDAATMIVVRDPGTRPAILMGRRRRNAVFMPGKFVFPGGAVDDSDATVPLDGALGAACTGRLAAEGQTRPMRFAAAAIRELFEETGLFWGRPGTFRPPSPDWEGFSRRGLAPIATGLAYVFRAVTPPGRPRRFDARFLLADAAGLAGDPDDFSRASGELTEISWFTVSDLGGLDIADVTRDVLAAVLPRLPDLGPPEHLPFRTGGRLA